MELFIYDTLFRAVDVIDTIESFIWTEKYCGAGDFEISAKVTPKLLSVLQIDYYIKIAESDRAMVIETVQIESDIEAGDKLRVTGRTLESILDRRIVLRQIVIDGSFQTGVQSLLNENIISSLYPSRNVSNFTFSASTDPVITALTLEAQYYGSVLYDVIFGLCEQNLLGFKVLLNSSDQFVFSLYSGVDRSNSQTTNPLVVFSPTFDNLRRSDYVRTNAYKKTYGLVSGGGDNGDGYPFREQVWNPWSDFHPDLMGLRRREIFIDASDMPLTNEATGLPITEAEYRIQLIQRGLFELLTRPEYTIFDAEIDLTNTYKYGVDFFLGDLIQIEDSYGHSGRARVLEMTFSENLSGKSMYPKLQNE